ncbi:M13 family metallopeptidase [Caulobacter sp. 17J80-11]|uniref:M13 family metallopeptidase n=1 Tax=Caulobacter sp. 17J80-11 TaxID=2763502 RepID=UPI00165375CA|nr:M13-type metalloendopeptidase [Caulobacter sp. 17J80-11]MBC6980218.1 peptidase M13 [Caulobacter sp. 17J80-11]
MKKFLLCAAALAALAAASAAQAQDRVCLDSVCDKVSLFGVAADAAAPAGSGWTSTEAPKYGTWGFDTAGMDTSVKPGDSFFRYANGKALDALVIPSDRSTYGSFPLLRELSDNRLKVLVEKAAADTGAAAGSDQAKIGALYNSFMDEARIQQLDAAPLAKDLAAIRALKTKADVARSMGASNAGFGRSFFGVGVSEDAKDPERNTLYVVQSGLGLPDRDYYLKDTFADKKTAYEAYVARMLRNVGWENAGQAAKDIVALETKIAEASWSRIESRDRDKSYNPMTVAELEKYAPGFPWRSQLAAAGLGKVDKVVVRQKTALPKIAQIFADTPIETLKAWQAFHTVDQAAPYLSKRFSDAQWEFRSHTLQGAPEQRSRAKRGVSFAEGAMGEAIGREYVAAYFPPESKAKMEKLVADLKSALKTRIETKLDWMSPETKAQALDKLSKFGVKIGYPSKWRDYAGLSVDASDLYGNVLRSSAFEWAEDVAKLGKPVDKEEWGMTPQTVNAYYSSTRNEIVFPAAILQPPFFDPNADMAVNYGGIGGVIGHEIGHGFDDQGRKSDGHGVLRDWWTAEDAAKFKAQTDRFGAQYDTYEPLPGAHVQGGLTMGENIGDLAGITLALDAYHVSLNGAEAPVLDGITGDQRVFLGWAQVWRSKSRDDALKQQVVSDPHSPAEFRVIGPMRNVDAWYQAFGVQEGDKYYVKPEERVRIW